MMSFKRGYALVIGVGKHQYHSGLDVPITTADATAVQQTLQDPNLCGYPSSQVTLLTNEQATRANILAALTQFQQLPPEATLFLFFAGHGMLGTDGQYYLVTHEARIEGDRVVANTAVDEQTLIAHLNKIPAQRCLLIFNACHSAHIGPNSLSGEAPATSAKNLPSATQYALLGTGEGRILIVASKEEQYSYFTHGAQHTIFTQALLSGLRSEAPSRSGYIGVFGLYEHIYHEVKEGVAENYGQIQEPVLTAIKTVGSFPVALYRGASTLGAFSEDEAILQETSAERISPRTAERQFNNKMEHINSGGGAVFQGSTTINTGGGPFAGRDIKIGGDYVGGDKVKGDKVGGDKITVSGGGAVAMGQGSTAVGARGVNVGGSVSGNIITGDNNQINQGTTPSEVVEAFAKLQQAIQQSTKLEKDDKPAAKMYIENLQKEAGKGEAADEKTVEKWLIRLIDMGEDIAEVALNTFNNPIKGLATVYQKVAQKLQAKRTRPLS
jgi:hypothetical protein